MNIAMQAVTYCLPKPKKVFISKWLHDMVTVIHNRDRNSSFYINLWIFIFFVY